MLKNYLCRINSLNAHILYLFCIASALIINIVNYSHSNIQDMTEVMGTFIQIALPCYVIVPILAKRDTDGAKQMLLFLAIVLTITYTLKLTVPSKRPYGGSMSFPSGHTTGAFSGAVFLSLRYGKKYALFALPLALFVAFSRVYSRNHWPIDVVASIVICFVAGFLIIKKERQRKNLH